MFGITKLKIIGLLIAILTLAGSHTYVYLKGTWNAQAECKSDRNEAELEGVDRHDTIEKGVMGMDIPSLDNGLAYWLRD